MFECEAVLKKETKNYLVYELNVDDELIGNKDKLYVHKSLFEEDDVLASDASQEIRIKLLPPVKEE